MVALVCIYFSLQSWLLDLLIRDLVPTALLASPGHYTPVEKAYITLRVILLFIGYLLSQEAARSPIRYLLSGPFSVHLRIDSLHRREKWLPILNRCSSFIQLRLVAFHFAGFGLVTLNANSTLNAAIYLGLTQSDGA